MKTTNKPLNAHSLLPLWRLLWKEFRERRWWAIAWTLAILAVSLFAQAQFFCGAPAWSPSARYTGGSSWSPDWWIYLPLLLGGIVGLGGFSSELQRGRASFLFARPVRWQQVALAKVLFGVIISIGAPLLAAGIFRLTCPPPFHHFLTLPHVLAGIDALAWPVALCYVIGLACSVILPGLAGGAITVACISICMLLMFIISMLLVQCGYWMKLISLTGTRIDYLMYSMFTGFIYFALLGILWGAVVTVRSGLYYDYPLRIKLHAQRLLLAVLFGGMIGLCLPHALAERLFMHWYPTQAGFTISPGGSFAIVSYQQRYPAIFSLDILSMGLFSARYREDIIRLADHVVLHRTIDDKHDGLIDNYDWQWITDTVAFGRSTAVTLPATPIAHNYNIIYHLDSGKVVPTIAHLAGRPTPDGHYMFCNHYTEINDPKAVVHPALLCNLDNGRTVAVKIPNTDDGENKYPQIFFWWVSNDTIGYYTVHYIQHKNEDIPVTHEEVHYLRMPVF